jgi:two-component system cell cycle response regulator CtrA
MADLQARIDVLQDEIADLKERVARLEEALGMTHDVPLGLALTPAEARVLGILMKRDVAKKDMIMIALYDGRHAEKDIPEPKIVDVFVCKMRAKLKRYGLEIKTVWGIGYSMTNGSKDMVREMLKAQSAT